MAKIQVLDEHIANQIAAGEVVERPASVIKELIENAIDAGATKIDITAEEGGLDSIRITDNGSGIEPEDCETAFYRHATSKLASSHDLHQIRTLGFRGEALPSIAAVAKVQLLTSSSDSGLGRKLVIEGGTLKEAEDAPAPRGTDITVKELFFNTPARLKYMKTIQTELGHISDVVYRQALAHPEIAFMLKHNGNSLLQTSGTGDLLQVIAAIYGNNAARSMLTLDAEDPDYTLTGFAGRPELTRSNRSGVSTIVNGRYIRSQVLQQAIMRAYHTLLPIGRYPLAVLELTMHPSLVDVNVHPAKLEVRFSKESELAAFVEAAIKRCLSQEVLIPQVTKQKASRGSSISVIQEQFNFKSGFNETASGSQFVQPAGSLEAGPEGAAGLSGSLPGGPGYLGADRAGAADSAGGTENGGMSGGTAGGGAARGDFGGGEAAGRAAATGAFGSGATGGAVSGSPADGAANIGASGNAEASPTSGMSNAGMGNAGTGSGGMNSGNLAGSSKGAGESTAYVRESYDGASAFAAGTDRGIKAGGPGGSVSYGGFAQAGQGGRGKESGESHFSEGWRVKPQASAGELERLYESPQEKPSLPAFPELTLIGQHHGTYLIANNDTGLYLIDQHAAHERVNYEYYYEKFGAPADASQELLIPITIEFTPSEAEKLKERLHWFEAAGVILEHFGGQTFRVTAYPHWFPKGEEEDIIGEMADWVLSEKAIDLAKLREASSTMCSCRASIKANQKLTHEQAATLLKRLATCRQPYTCPHGRPIVISFSAYDLEKLFKRVM